MKSALGHSLRSFSAPCRPLSAVTPIADKMLRCRDCPLSAKSGHKRESGVILSTLISMLCGQECRSYFGHRTRWGME
jgi:hypothetical protein